MIRVERTNPPKVLVDKSIIWREALANAKSKPERERCQNRYRHAQIKATLKRLFVGKCAYCESKITHVDYGHIEHFRPKAGPHGRPELTFDWTNLFLACGICNGAEFKSDRFPKAAEGGPLVNPCDDDPGQHFTFEYDSHAKLASVCGKTTRGDLTVNVLGLNRHDLRAYRSHQIRRIVALASLASVEPRQPICSKLPSSLPANMQPSPGPSHTRCNPHDSHLWNVAGAGATVTELRLAVRRKKRRGLLT